MGDNEPTRNPLLPSAKLTLNVQSRAGFLRERKERMMGKRLAQEAIADALCNEIGKQSERIRAKKIFSQLQQAGICCKTKEAV